MSKNRYVGKAMAVLCFSDGRTRMVRIPIKRNVLPMSWLAYDKPCRRDKTITFWLQSYNATYTGAPYPYVTAIYRQEC